MPNRSMHLGRGTCECDHIIRVGQYHIYLRCIYDILGREIINFTVINGADIRFWPTLYIYSVYMIFMAGKSPNVRSYMVHLYGCGQPYICCTEG